jgi:hypothetical protein
MTEIVSDKISLYENKHRIIHNLSQHVLQKNIVISLCNDLFVKRDRVAIRY